MSSKSEIVQEFAARFGRWLDAELQRAPSGLVAFNFTYDVSGGADATEPTKIATETVTGGLYGFRRKPDVFALGDYDWDGPASLPSDFQGPREFQGPAWSRALDPRGYQDWCASIPTLMDAIVRTGAAQADRLVLGDFDFCWSDHDGELTWWRR